MTLRQLSKAGIYAACCRRSIAPLEDPWHLQWGAEGGGYILQGVTNPEDIASFMTSSGGVCGTNGEVLPWGAVFMIPPGSETCIANEDAHRWFSVVVPIESLRSSDLLLCSGQ